MNKLKDNLRAILKLITTCRDGELRFRSAAHRVESEDLQKLFLIYAEQRRQFGVELQSEIRRLGGVESQQGDEVGPLPRSWEVQTVFTYEDEDAVIGECDHGEDLAVKDYEEALRRNLAPEVEMLVFRQYKKIGDTHSRIRNLQEASYANA